MKKILPSPITDCLYLLTLSFLLFLLTSTAHAHGRRFAYIQEATVADQGEFEYEQWVTWKANKDSDPDFHQFDFRHEFEFGVTDRFQAALYLPDWRYTSGKGAEFRDVSLELKYMLYDPRVQPLGFTLYYETKIGDQRLVLEPKLIFQKNVGPWIFAYNFVFEAKWSGSGLSHSAGEIKNIAGISRRVADDWFLGAELEHKVEIEEWSDWSDHVVGIGPNLTYKRTPFFFTLTPLFQASNVDSEPNFVTRAICGIEF